MWWWAIFGTKTISNEHTRHKQVDDDNDEENSDVKSEPEREREGDEKGEGES